MKAKSVDRRVRCEKSVEKGSLEMGRDWSERNYLAA